MVNLLFATIISILAAPTGAVSPYPATSSWRRENNFVTDISWSKLDLKRILHNTGNDLPPTGQHRNLQVEELNPIEFLSPTCVASSFILNENAVFEIPNPSATPNSTAVVLDFSANETAFAAFDEFCNSVEGNTLIWNATFGNQCGDLSFFEFQSFPLCVGPACTSEEDQLGWASFVMQSIFLESAPSSPDDCEILELTHEIDGHEAQELITSVSNECVYDTVFILSFSDAYENYPGDVVDEFDGTFNGNQTAYSLYADACSIAGGRIVKKADFNPSPTCQDPAFFQVPLCVSMVCTSNDDAEAAFNYALSLTSEPDCQSSKVSIKSKTPKGAKNAKASKTPKTFKAPKAKKGKKQKKRFVV